MAQELGKSTSLIGRWSSHWFWGKRVDAWDGFQDDRKRQARIDVIEQMSTRHSQTVQSALTILSMPVREAMNRFKQDPAILEMMELEDVMKLAIVCARTIPGLVESERLTRGAPTDISEITHQGGDRPVKLKIDWSDDWRSD